MKYYFYYFFFRIFKPFINPLKFIKKIKETKTFSLTPSAIKILARAATLNRFFFADCLSLTLFCFYLAKKSALPVKVYFALDPEKMHGHSYVKIKDTVIDALKIKNNPKEYPVIFSV